MKRIAAVCLSVWMGIGNASLLRAAAEDPFQFFGEEATAVSSRFFKTETRKAPGYVYTIDRKAMDHSSARSLHELFEQYVPGMSATYHFFGSLIGQRGIQIDANPKTAFLLDGKNINTR